jgi:amino acid permease
LLFVIDNLAHVTPLGLFPWFGGMLMTSLALGVWSATRPSKQRRTEQFGRWYGISLLFWLAVTFAMYFTENAELRFESIVGISMFAAILLLVPMWFAYAVTRLFRRGD